MKNDNNNNTWSYPEEFFRTNEIITKITGMYIPTKDDTVWMKVFYTMYLICFYTTGIIFIVCEVLIFNETITNFNKLISHIGMLFTHLCGILKCIILIFGRKKLQRMMNTLQDVNYYYSPLDNFSPGLMLSKEKKASSLISVVVFIMYSFVGISAHISSEMILNEEIKSEAFKGTNKTCQDFMPYFFYVPFDTEMKSQCKRAFLIMDVGLVIFAWVISCYDGIFVSLLNCLKSQLQIVCHVFRSLRSRSLKKLQLKMNCNDNYNENSALENEMYKELTHSTEHLKILLRVRDDVEATFTFVTLTQTVASLLIFASCLYIASNVPINSPEFFAQMEYFMCVLVQLSLICWFGNEITTASELIPLSLYEGDWLSSSPRFKTSMMLTMTRMQRPVYLSIGKFSPLTLATLVAVCRGSFSYLALFKNVQ